MQPEYPRGLSFRPFAIRFAFTTNHSLDNCIALLSEAQIIRGYWSRLLGRTFLTFRFTPNSLDLCDFDAERGPRNYRVIARGYLQRIDVNTCSVIGYCDAPLWFYIVLALGTVLGIFWSFKVSLDFTIIIGVLFFVGAVANILIMRRKAQQLARIIEEPLTKV